MKEANWENSRVRNLVDHETPFMVIDCPGGRCIKLWWTKGGAYGPQVMALIYGEGRPLHSFTNGCGYNKTHAALEECFSELGRAPRGFKRSLYDYHVGGNYHRVTKKHWLKYR